MQLHQTKVAFILWKKPPQKQCEILQTDSRYLQIIIPTRDWSQMYKELVQLTTIKQPEKKKKKMGKTK